ncbi:MAG: AAA family ATPase [Treponema sp.]|nr:AAA family ATPase [Treponema sp.]
MKENCIDCLLRTDTEVTSEELFAMTRYVPYRVVKSIGEAACCFFDKKIEKLFGVVIYLDIKGFTSIVDGYMKTGRDIADLQSTLSDYYSVIIETVREFGGSVFQFAGDSILICFDKLPNESDEDNLRRALAAMILALDLSDNYNVVSEQIVGFTLHPKIGIGYGEFFQITLGTTERYMTPVLAGTAVIQAVKMEEMCEKQEIVVSFPVWNLACNIGLEKYFAEQEGFFHLTDIPEDFAHAVERPEYTAPEDLFSNPRFYNRVYSFINPIILNQIKNNVQGFSGDYRDVTCCMVRFDGVFEKAISESSIAEGYASLNKVYEIVQDISTRFGGYCGKPDLSDKGIVFPVFFGMPVAIENKERMAILFANELINEEKIDSNKISVNVGISTGVAYAGEFGANMRKDFTIVGNAINFAARLMMNASNHGRFAVFIDSATRRKTQKMCNTESRPAIMLKGFAEKQVVFQFMSVKKQIEKADYKTALLGRMRERIALLSLYEQCSEKHVVLAPIMGDVGLGKSYLVEQFLADVTNGRDDIIVLHGAAYPYEEETPFFMWREIVKQIISIDDAMKGEDLLQHVAAVFAEIVPDNKNWISYFLLMLGFNFVENQFTKGLDDAAKQKHFYAIVYALIVHYAKQHPLIIVLEDIECSDAISLHMLEYICMQQDRASVFIIPVSRESKKIRQLFARNNVSVMQLGRIDNNFASQLARELLNFETPDKSLIEKITTMANGNPLFINIIVESLIDSGAIEKTAGGHNRLVKEMPQLKIPYTIQNFVLARLSALPFEAQVICKNASVIGFTFSLSMLSALIPETLTQEVVEHSLELLVEQGLIMYINMRKTLFGFKEALIRDVIYRTIIEATKKSLNRTMMEYLEEKYKDDIVSVADKLLYYATEAKEEEAIEKYSKLVVEMHGDA